MARNTKKCDVANDDHDHYRDTGRTGVNPQTGHTWRERACQCGAKRFEYFPHLRK
jgi:hypothetical protein